jgi:hypothetical protein
MPQQNQLEIAAPAAPLAPVSTAQPVKIQEINRHTGKLEHLVSHRKQTTGTQINRHTSRGSFGERRFRFVRFIFALPAEINRKLSPGPRFPLSLFASPFSKSTPPPYSLHPVLHSAMDFLSATSALPLQSPPSAARSGENI